MARLEAEPCPRGLSEPRITATPYVQCCRAGVAGTSASLGLGPSSVNSGGDDLVSGKPDTQ